MSWIEPITDRSQQDVEAQTPKAYCNAADLNRLEGNCAEVAALLRTDGRWTGTVRCRTDWQGDSLPTATALAKICQNLATLAAAYPAYRTTPPPPTPPLNHWEKWNDGETLLAHMHQSLLDHRRDRAYSGELTAGDGPGLG